MAVFTAKSTKPYNRWIIVAAGFFIWSVSFGIQYSFGVFFKPLQEDFGWSRATISWAMTINLLVFALFMIPVGWAIDHFRPTFLYSGAAIIFGLTLSLSSRISSAWQFYVLYGLMGIGVSICGPVVLAVVTRWFKDKRGLALGITSAGVGLGQLIGAPLINALITSYSWRDAFVILGIGSFIIVFVCSFFFKASPPAENIEKPYQAASMNYQSLPPKQTFGRIIRSRTLYLLVVTQVFMSFTLRVVTTHIAPHAIDIGFTPAIGALAVGVIGGTSIIGRVGVGLIQDKAGAERSMLACLLLQAVSLAFLPLLNSPALFFAFAAVFGLTYGGDVPQMPVLVAQSFGLASISIMYTTVQTAGYLAASVGPIYAGYVFDVTGSYTIVFLSIAAGIFVASLCVNSLRMRQRSLLILEKQERSGSHAG